MGCLDPRSNYFDLNVATCPSLHYFTTVNRCEDLCLHFCALSSNALDTGSTQNGPAC